MDIDGQPGQGQDGYGRGHGRVSGLHSTIEPTNVAAAEPGTRKSIESECHAWWQKYHRQKV